MNIQIKYVLLILAALIIGVVCLCIVGSNYFLREEQSNLTKGNLAYLQKVILTYKQDSEKSGKVNIYPETLRALVDENYLSNADIAELTNGAVVEYFKPMNNSNLTVIILRATVGRVVYVCPLSGPIRKEQ